MIKAVIPARYASTRLPGKPLEEIGGKTMIERVYTQALKAPSLHSVVVATDDERIFNHVKSFGGEVMMTSPEHPSGTDRVIEVAKAHPGFKAYLNIQGDEPFITPHQIDLACKPLQERDGSFVSTLILPTSSKKDLENPSIIKVVIAKDGRALYFSRSPIPHVRNADEFESWSHKYSFYKHIGIYGYSAEAIERIAQLTPSGLELAEKLEQLRWMEDGIPIITQITHEASFSIDTPEDLEKARKLVNKHE